MAGCSMVLLSGIFAVFAVAFLAVIFAAIFILILALILLIIGIVKKKHGKKSGKVLIIISSIMLTIWFAVCGLLVWWMKSSEDNIIPKAKEQNTIEDSSIEPLN